MLYPTLENGHEVLGQEYCSGYTDTFGKWNTGFYCPLIIPNVPVFCCGSLVLKYCCTLGKPIPGGHYSKGYDNRLVVQVENGQDADEDDEAENEGTESQGVVVTVPHVGGESGAGTQPVDDPFFNQKSLLIGSICGVVALTALITIVMCFYCSCCMLYKKRRGRRLPEGGLLYGIPVVSSSQTTTCGSLGNITGGSSGGHGMSTATSEPANVCQSNSSTNTNTTALPNFITTTSLDPLVDYWTGTSTSSTSCGVGIGCGASNTVIVAATPTCLPHPSIVGGSAGQPHHHIHGSVYHHHHHYTGGDLGTGVARAQAYQGVAPPPSALEPPPPYGLVVAGPVSVPLVTNCCETATGSSNDCTIRTPRRTGIRDSNNSADSNTNYLIQRQLCLMHANNVSNTTSPATVSNGNSPNNSTCTTSLSSSTATATATNAISRLLSSATGGSGLSRGSLPPPYFVEQYRIRNRARPPPFPSNSSRSASERSRTQETLHNLLYPLLNSSSVGTTATGCSNSSGGGRSSRRRVSTAAGNLFLGTHATDTQSEPRRRAHTNNNNNGNHNQNRNCTSRYGGGVGSRLHRSSSDRQQTSHSGSLGDGESGRSPYFSVHSQEGEGVVVVMNNVINNLSGTRARGDCNGETRHEGNGQVGVGDERRRAAPATTSDSSGGIVGSDNAVKILNTQYVHRLQGSGECWGAGGVRQGQRSRGCSNQQMNFIPMRRLPSATHHQNSGNSEERNVFGNDDLRERGSDSDRGSDEGGIGTRRMMGGDDDDIIMMTEDDDEEMIAVVTTTTTSTSTTIAAQQEDEEEDDQVDMLDNLVVMGCFGDERNDCEEDYLVGGEEEEENSMGKLSGRGVNSLRMSASHSKDDYHDDEPSSEDEQTRNDNGKETRTENRNTINNNNDNDNSDISGCSSVSAAGTTGRLDRELMTVVAKES